MGAEIAGPNGQSGWIGQEINGPNGPGAWTSYGSNFLRYMAPGAKADNADIDPVRLFRQFDIDKDPARMADLRPDSGRERPGSFRFPAARAESC